MGWRKMHFGLIRTFDVANGPGIRISLFVSGCTNKCKGCFQPETWDFQYGKPYTKSIEDAMIQELAKPHYRGITILGGEPFEPSNQVEIIKIIRRIRKEMPEKDIWVYTGNLLDVDLIPGGKKYCLVTEEILRSIDVLVDGQFIEAQKNLSLKFKGSENQRVIDMMETIKRGEIVLAHDYNN